MGVASQQDSAAGKRQCEPKAKPGAQRRQAEGAEGGLRAGVGGSDVVRLALATIFLTGCATAPDVKPTEARLQVISVPASASVYVDGHYFGRAKVLAEVPEALKPGPHFVTIEADDHFPHDLEVDLKPGTTTITVELRPIPK